MKPTDLFQASVDLNERGLLFSNKWASQHLMFITGKHPVVKNSSKSCNYFYAKSCFDLKEYQNVVSILKGENDFKSLFLFFYSKYLDIESSENNFSEKNLKLEMLKDELESHYINGNYDGFLCYLYAVLLLKQNLKEEAKRILLESISLYPYNWSAYLDLIDLLQNFSEAQDVIIGKGFMRDFFLCQAALKLSPESDLVVSILDSLDLMFPNNPFILAQRGIFYYNIRHFDLAEEIFEQYHEKVPSSVEYMDIYSNILFVKEEKVRLGILAQKCSRIGKYKPETCCVIGNYYSISGEHEKAITYFKRALKLNQNYLCAWILMGHEYLEVGNTYAALDAYRKAIDVNNRDFRAWFGLGQTYEMLRMNYYSLYYYKKATSLQPHDKRMWAALASTYEALDQGVMAIKCYERIISGDQQNDENSISWLKMGKLYDKIGRIDEAVHFMTLGVKSIIVGETLEKNPSQELIECLLYLSNFHKKEGEFKLSEKYTTLLLDTNGPEKEEAKSIMRELRSITHKVE